MDNNNNLAKYRPHSQIEISFQQRKNESKEIEINECDYIEVFSSDDDSESQDIIFIDPREEKRLFLGSSFTLDKVMFDCADESSDLISSNKSVLEPVEKTQVVASNNSDAFNQIKKEIEINEMIRKTKWCICKNTEISTDDSNLCIKCGEWYHLVCSKLTADQIYKITKEGHDFNCLVCRNDKDFIDKNMESIIERRKHSKRNFQVDLNAVDETKIRKSLQTNESTPEKNLETVLEKAPTSETPSKKKRIFDPISDQICHSLKNPLAENKSQNIKNSNKNNVQSTPAKSVQSTPAKSPPLEASSSSSSLSSSFISPISNKKAKSNKNSDPTEFFSKNNKAPKLGLKKCLLKSLEKIDNAKTEQTISNNLKKNEESRNLTFKDHSPESSLAISNKMEQIEAIKSKLMPNIMDLSTQSPEMNKDVDLNCLANTDFSDELNSTPDQEPSNCKVISELLVKQSFVFFS